MAAHDKRKRGDKGKGPQQYVNYKTMSTADYILLRQRDMYEEARRDGTISPPRFWCKEHQGIYRDIFSKIRTRPMRPLNIEVLKNKGTWAVSVDVTERMGLHTLMEKQCDYSTELIKQFYSTVVFGTDEGRTMKWMSGTTYCEADFHRFANVLGYEFDGASNPSGNRIISAVASNKDVVLSPLYDEGGIVGQNTGFLPIYQQLVTIFRDTICPSGGNNDAIRGNLVELLAFAHEVEENDDPNIDVKLDVMDFIFHEMYDAMIKKKSMPYAPYIMALIKDVLSGQDFSAVCDAKHNPKKLYNKKPKKTAAQPAAPDAFMSDARRGPRTRNPPTPSITTEVKKLTWYQKMGLCMGINSHKAQHKEYVSRLEMDHKYDMILHHVTKKTGPEPKKATPIAYKDWNNAGVNYLELERCLFEIPAEAVPRKATNSNDEDDESSDEDLPEDGNSEESEEGEQAEVSESEDE